MYIKLYTLENMSFNNIFLLLTSFLNKEKLLQ